MTDTRNKERCRESERKLHLLSLTSKGRRYAMEVKRIMLL